MDFDKTTQTSIIEGHDEAVGAMFRAIHTLKRSAGFFGLDPIVSFAHTVESVIDRVRAGSLGFDPSLVSLVVACHDHLGKRLAGLQEGRDVNTPEIHREGEALLNQLLRYLDETPTPSKAHRSVVTPYIHQVPPAEEKRPCWHISIRFGLENLRQGMDPLPFLSRLNTLGTIVQQTPLLDRLPLGAEFDPRLCYLGLEIDLDSKADRQTIEDVFEFVREDSQIRVTPCPFSKRQKRWISLKPDDGRQNSRPCPVTPELFPCSFE